MISGGRWPIGICSWSLKNDVHELAAVKMDMGISHVHLAIAPALGPDGRDYLAAVQKQQWTIAATMIGFAQEDYSSLESIKQTGGIVPDNCWPENKELVINAINMTASLNVKFLEFHFGFIEESDPIAFGRLIDRMRILADAAEKKNVLLLMETGQESADTLRHFLEQLAHPAVAVNFDPANMILYGKGNPIKALDILHPWIKNVHAKDAIAGPSPGMWGKEMPWGDGQVCTDEFLRTLLKNGYTGSLCIEREAGNSRFEDIRVAVARLRAFTGIV